MRKYLISLSLSIFALTAGADTRWHITPDNHTIVMPVAKSIKPHADHMEMSGKKMAVVMYWDVDSAGVFGLNRRLVFPMLRTIPNDTHASLILDNNIDVTSLLRVNDKIVKFVSSEVGINGGMTVVSEYSESDRNGKKTAVELRRSIFPTMEHAAMIEQYTATNTGDKPVTIQIPDIDLEYTTDSLRGVQGEYIVASSLEGIATKTLSPGESAEFNLIIQAYAPRVGNAVTLNPTEEYQNRMDFINQLDNNLILHTPDSVIDTEFRYAKIRGSESIYKTKGGYMHGPGGERYYAALWANDQAEYINPFFPFLGYEVGNESAFNCFKHYARYMNDEYTAIPSSIIAEGDGYWNGARDRGDAAMLAYGASRYALAKADKTEAEELWKLIEWCLEYNKRRLNDKGVVLSDYDELESRFPAGDANLCTASLYYDALQSAVCLGKELGKDPKLLADYSQRAKAIREAIENHFGANVQGYDTYRYYEGNDVLRSWICIPLVMGINDRAEATVDALFSPEMYTDDGVLTCQGYKIFWDRATLYTLRGALYAGYPDKVIPRLSALSQRRLLGDHVPYPIEAWPEGSQRHLSAESGLYCRIITEGLFGIRPTGMHSFSMKPELPSNWDFAELKHIRAFGRDFDILVNRISSNRLKVTIVDHKGKTQTHKIKAGQTLNIKL